MVLEAKIWVLDGFIITRVSMHLNPLSWQGKGVSVFYINLCVYTYLQIFRYVTISIYFKINMSSYWYL